LVNSFVFGIFILLNDGYNSYKCAALIIEMIAREGKLERQLQDLEKAELWEHENWIYRIRVHPCDP
jgi:hypothetical protein